MQYLRSSFCFFLLCLLTLAAPLYSPPLKAQSNTFTRTFPEYDLYELDLKETGDGYLIVGVDGFTGNNQILMVKLDRNGEKTWEKIINFSEESDGAYSVDIAADGYIVAGYIGLDQESDRDALIFKVDKDGNILWKKIYGASRDDYATSIKTVPDGYIVAGYTKGRGPKPISYWLAKLDTDGSLMWEKFYGSKLLNYAREVIVNKSGYTIAGSTSSGEGSWEAYLVNTDCNGNLNWEKRIEGKTFQDLANYDDGILLLTAEEGRYGWINKSFLAELTETGTITWEKEIQTKEGRPCSGISIDGNRIITFGTSYTKEKSGRFILRIDKNGEIIDEKSTAIDLPGLLNIKKVIITANGYLSAGTQKLPGHEKNMLYLAVSDNQLTTAVRTNPFQVLPESKRELLYAVFSGNTALLDRLIEHGADVNQEMFSNGVTPLFIATESGKDAIIKVLLKNGAALTGGIFEQEPALHTAARGGSVWFINELRTKYAALYNEQINKPDYNNETPLSIAIANDNKKVIDYLLENGADVSPEINEISPLFTAIKSNNIETAERLITQGIDIHQTDPENDKTALHYGVESGNNLLVGALLSKGADPNARDRDGATPLHYAASGPPEICEMLLKNKAEVNIAIASGEYQGQTPLQIAILNNNIQNTSLLIKHGADVNCAIAVRFLPYRGRSEEECSLLEYAMINENLIIAYLLVNAGADIKKAFVVDYYKGVTPLHVAILKKDYSLIMNLLAHGADINAKAEIHYYGKVTPVELAYANDLKDLFDYTGTGKNILNRNLAAAVKGKDYQKIKQSLAKGADVNYRIKDPQSKNESDILELAVKTGDIAVVKLITEGLIKQERISYPKRAFSIAIENKDNEIFKYLYSKFKPTFSKYSEPSMAEAVYNHNIEVLKFLIERKHNIRNQDFNTYTMINYAFRALSPEMAQIIRNATDLSPKDKSLYTAIYQNDIVLVKKALAKDADLNALDIGDISPLCWASFLGHTPIVEYLIAKGAVVQSDKIYGDRSPIYWASAMGHTDTVKLLIKHGADIRAYDPWSYECLHIAAEHGHADVVNLLLDSGADINTHSYRNGYCSKAIHIAAANGHVNVIKALLARGQSINAHDNSDSDGNNVVIGDGDDDWETPLMAAIRNNQFETVKFLLDHKADIAVPKNRGNCLHLAVYSNNIELVKLLLQYNLDLNALNDHNETPLMVAVRNNKVEMANYLLSLGSDCSTVDKSGSNLLHLAAERNLLELAGTIIKKNENIDINLIDKYGQTPLSLAAQNNNAAMVSLLLKHGADVNLKLPVDKDQHITVIELTTDYPVWKLLRDAGAKYWKEI